MAAERFHIVREIARGGMGRVVEAIDLQLGRTVALKQALDDDPEARSRFAREVEITARLEHPSIVPVYDAGDSLDGAPFYVMRKVSGAPLDRLLAEATTLDDRLRLLPNLLAVADAVAHAHGRGVIHRDLKPANVLVGELGETVVIDWGLAKIVGEAEPATDPLRPPSGARPLETTVGTVIGTPGFMAPEQVTAGATDARTDVYALGACLYAVLVGAPPLAGLAEPEILSRTVDGRIVPLADAVAGVPPDLVSIVDKAMARDPGARYLDAGGLSEDLRRFLTGQLVASHRYGTGQRLVRWLRRHRAIVAVVGVAVAILIAVAVIAVRRIIAAGDRTAAALARERDRSDDLIVSQAIDRIDTDPTLAAATLQQLRPESPRWPTLGPVVSAMRARGVAVGYPGMGAGNTRVFFAPDPADARALVSDGSSIHLLDLAARTATVLVTGRGFFSQWAGSVVMISGQQGEAFLLDPRTGARVTFPWPRSIVSWDCAAGLVAFVDESGAAGVVDAAGGLPLTTPPVALPIDVHATTIAISPGATWIVAGDHTHARVLHRDAPDRLGWTVVDHPVPDRASGFVWDRAERRMVYVLDRDTFVVDLATWAEQRWPVWAFDPAFAGDRLLAVELTTSVLHELAPDGRDGEVTRIRGIAGHVVAIAGDTAVELEDSRTIVLDRRPFRHILRPPLEISQVFAQPDGHWLIGVNAAAVVAWDLDEILPERAEVPVAEGFAFVGDRSVVAIDAMDSGHGGRPVYRYDLADRPFAAAVQPLGAVSFARQPYYGPDGVVLAYGIDGSIESVTPSIPSSIPGILIVVGGEPGHALVGTQAGEIHDVTPDGDRVVATLAGPVNALAARHGWLVAMTTDGALWRRDPRGAITSATEAAAPRGIAVNARGDVVIATDDKLIEWPTGSAPVGVADLDSPPTGLIATVDDRFAVLTHIGVLHRYDPATRALAPILPATTDVAFSRDGARAAALIDRAIVVVDLAGGERWTVFDHVDVGSGFLALSPDGDTLLAGEAPPRRHPAIDRWRIAMPADPRAWVMAATNAQAPAVARGAIGWRPLAAAP